VCVAGTALAIRHYRDVLLDADPDTTWPFPDESDRPHIAIAPDGKRVAIWDAAELRVIDTATGRVLMTFADVANVEAVELDPTGADRVMLDLERSCPRVAGRCCIPGPQFERAKSLSPRSASHRRAHGGTVHV